jgi:hypothetical protein
MSTKYLTLQTGYDAVDVNALPYGGTVYSGYVDGAYPNMAGLQARFPNSLTFGFSVSPQGKAQAYDCEQGNGTVYDCPGFYWANHQDYPGGIIFYIGAEDGEYSIDSLISVMSHAGIDRSSYWIVSAHWTYIPHICGPDTCGVTGYNADGTQYASGDYDTDLYTPEFVNMLAGISNAPTPVPTPTPEPIPEVPEMFIIIRNAVNGACSTYNGVSRCYIRDAATFNAYVEAGVKVAVVSEHDYLAVPDVTRRVK